MSTSTPLPRSAPTKAAEKSARPPTFTRGANSAVAKRTLTYPVLASEPTRAGLGLCSGVDLRVQRLHLESRGGAIPISVYLVLISTSWSAADSAPQISPDRPRI